MKKIKQRMLQVMNKNCFVLCGHASSMLDVFVFFFFNNMQHTKKEQKKDSNKRPQAIFLI